MIELRNHSLQITSPVHPDAITTIGFQRTLRIPDDGTDYPLPAGLGPFPLCHVEDYADTVPDAWTGRGGVMLPMWRTEAMWLSFSGAEYPWAIKIAAGKRCAITGEPFTMGLHDDSQDYLVVPAQPWLDGFAMEKGRIRQFVAMTLGEGYTLEEQLSGTAEWGGLQIVAYPMKADRWERILARRRRKENRMVRGLSLHSPMPMAAHAAAPMSADMRMAAGGLMRQEIRRDRHGLDAWDTDAAQRAFVHLCDAQVWRHIIGQEPPTVPPTAHEYEQAGIPWFNLPNTGDGVGGTGGLTVVKSVADLGKAKGGAPLPDNAGVKPGKVIGLSPAAVSDGHW